MESEAPIKLPSASVVKALFAEANRVKEQLSSISGTFGDRIKTQQEVGNLCGPAFRQAASIYKKGKNNELKAKEHLYHLRAYLDWVEEDLVNRGHVGNLVDLADEEDGDEQEPEDEGDLNSAPTGEGGVPLGDAQKQFEATKAVAENRRNARKALDLPEDGSAGKPQSGRKAKPETEEAAPPPPPGSSDEDNFERDIRPGFLRRQDEERAARDSSVH